MNKYFLLVAIFFMACCSVLAEKPKEEKFVNPLFYKVMRPLGSVDLYWHMQLTPTKITFHHIKTGTVVEQNCFLTDNKEMSVTLNCDTINDFPNREQIVCTRMPENDQPYYSGGYVQCKTAFQQDGDNYNTDKAHYSEISPYIVDLD